MLSMSSIKIELDDQVASTSGGHKRGDDCEIHEKPQSKKMKLDSSVSRARRSKKL